MNTPEDPIEGQLRRAPSPTPPPGLRRQLIDTINLGDSSPVSVFDRSLLRRWWPILASASLACATLVVVGLQQNEIRSLHRQLAGLPSAPGRVATPETDADVYAPASVPLADARADLERLRRTVAELKTGVAGLEALRAENERLRAQVRAHGTSADADDIAAMGAAREKAQRIACVNNMKQLGLAARVWATDNSDVLPPDILSMSNEIAAPKVLVCPADTGRQPATGWSTFTLANTSYEFLAPSGSEAEPERVMFRCPIHNNYTLCDGSVQQVSAARAALVSQRNGKTYLDDGPPVTSGASGPQPVIDPRMAERYGLKPAPAPQE